MATLQEVIESANSIYNLALTADDIRQIRSKMLFAGFDFKNITNTSSAVTTICKLAGNKGMQTAAASYRSMKEATSSTATAYNGTVCPRCKATLKLASLANKREVQYCAPCRIAMPTKS